jgi:glycosyltransferase involved in cell wall biosynthesis
MTPSVQHPASVRHEHKMSGRTDSDDRQRLRVLLSAYACEPGKGSEPGVGWNWATQIARFADVWVLTRSNNRIPIEAALATEPMHRARFIFYDLPWWLRFWKRKQRGILLYYYLWQIGAYWKARQLNRQVRFDVTHHVTFVKYWMPTFLSLLPAPSVWGPIGGGESMPEPFRRTLSLRGKVYEVLRDVARSIGERDPLLRITARRAELVLATTEDSKARLLTLGCPDVRVYSESGLSDRDMAELSRLTQRDSSTFRILSSGNLLHLKAFDLSLRAFAPLSKEGLVNEYWIVGDGPERSRLERLAEDLGVRQQIVFWGRLERSKVLAKLAECDVLVHPSLHDSGGWVCLEAMAAGRPVICLDLGGPGVQVTESTGIKVRALTPEQTVKDLTAAIRQLREDLDLRTRLGKGGRHRVAEEFTWAKKGEHMHRTYNALVRMTRENSA